jgi:ketosteroid isomerase-like protein
MTQESTTPDLVERVRLLNEALSRRDFDAFEGFFAPDAVFWGPSIGTFEGAAAIRGLAEDAMRSYEEFNAEAEEIIDLGNGVVFGVNIYRGRPIGSSAEVRFRFATVAIWAEGLNERNTHYIDIDEARAAAERLAEERG